MALVEDAAPRAAIAKPAGKRPASPPNHNIELVGGIVRLGIASVACWFTPPFSWWREAADEGWTLVKRCFFPTVLSCFIFAFGASGIQAGTLLETLGAADRLGSAVSVGALREFVPWVAGMVVAGVAGTAIAADLGARRVRDELDAMAVLGVDAVRTLVAPRVLALTMLMPAMNVMGLVAAAGAGFLAETSVLAGTPAAYFESFRAGFTSIDLVANILKTICFGFIVATICSYKGMNAKGGSEGVGRAVNEAVVLAFIAVWVFNFAFNATYQSAFPAAQDVR